MIRENCCTETRVLVLTSKAVLHPVTQAGTARAETDVGGEVTAPVETPGALQLTEAAVAVSDGEAEGGALQAAGVDGVETVGLLTPVPAH